MAEAIRSSQKRFYVYVLLRSDGQAFYVGKGLGQRIFNHEAEARNTNLKSHKLNTIRSIIRRGDKIGYAIPHFCDDESQAHTLEVSLIEAIGRHDLKKGPLTNQTSGGEGATGLSAETMARRAANLGGLSDDPQRRVANEFFHSIAGMQDSVPIKPVNARRLEPTIPHAISRKPTQRMATVIVASCLASNQLLAEGVALPRRFVIEGNLYVIENGVSKDMLKANMIRVLQGDEPELEQFVLTRIGFEAVLRFIVRTRLEDLGVLEPSA